MTTARAPAAGRALARDADAPAEEPVAGGWRARAQRFLLAQRARAIAAWAHARQVLLAAATAALDAGIASLQRLRAHVGGTEPEEHAADRERTGKSATTRQPENEPAAEETAAPKPRHRLRGLLVYLSVMLAGGMGGMALAYDLLAHLLDQRTAEIRRQEAALSKHAKSAAELKEKLEQQQAKQIETETRLTAVLAENRKMLGEVHAGRNEAGAPAARGHGGRAARDNQAASNWAGSCTLVGGNIRSALNGCIAEMNRR